MDDPTPTPNSDPTPTPTPSDPPGGDPKPADPKPADGDPAPKGDNLGGTALGSGDDPKPGEGGDPKSPQAAVPEKYELTAPEGFTLDEKALETATPVFKELGLSNEQADKLMPVAADFAKRLVDQRDQQFLGQILEQRKAWLNDAKADKEIGGANWDTTMQSAARAMDRLGFPKGSPLRVALDESGFGNHPEMIRFAAAVGKAIGEDSDFVRSDAGANKPKELKELFYPGQSKREG